MDTDFNLRKFKELENKQKMVFFVLFFNCQHE